MSRPISTDLGERLVLAVSREGISARAAAARFGVSVSSAIIWVRRYRETGSVAPGKIGGYKPNILSGVHGDWLVERAKSDFTLRGLVAELAERGVSFAEWVEQFLVPTLAPGDIVIMDNLSSHKRPAIRQAIRAAKAKLLYLPPYSPHRNPIEQMFSKLKHLLRKASERTAENTSRRIGSLLDAFSPQKCNNYCANSGYAST